MQIAIAIAIANTHCRGIFIYQIFMYHMFLLHQITNDVLQIMWLVKVHHPILQSCFIFHLIIDNETKHNQTKHKT
jgi:hypothetical protein